MKKNRKKRNRAGFSLAETLMAVLILLLASAIVAAGMPMAREAYEKAIDAANAQTLLSTTVTMLRAELCEAADVETESQTIAGVGTVPNVVKSFRSSRTGAPAALSNSDLGIQVTDNVGVNTVANNLVTSEAATSRLHTAFDYIKYEDGLFTVYGLKVFRSGTGTVASLGELNVKTVNS